MPDPDLEISWGGGGGGSYPKNIFPPFGLQFGLKIRGAQGGSATENSSLLKMPEHSNM